jgi:ubiquinone/menaquinone biosynthesis C-methylase UbiE
MSAQSWPMPRNETMTVRSFYDDLAARYHLVYQDWDASIARQGEALDALLREHFPDAHTIFDVAVGIGTQALGLSALDYQVIGSDVSSGAVRRAADEATKRELTMPLYVADFQRLPVRSGGASVVLCCDNSLPHLASADAIRAALTEWHRCVRAGGGCLISMRDYGEPRPSGTIEEHYYGERSWNGRRYTLNQVWTWNGPRYDVALAMTSLDDEALSVPVITTSYLAISPARVLQLMKEAGFQRVQRIDGRLFQPVLIGFKPAAP